METRNLVGMILAVTVGLICIGTVMLPILSDATTTEKTFTNEGYFYLDYVDNTYEKTIVWDYTDPTKLTIGDDVVSFPDSTSTTAYTFMATEDFFLRYVWSPTDVYLQLYRTSTTAQYRASVANEQTLTVTVSEGTATFDNGSGTTISETYDNMYCISAGTGEYVMKTSDSTAYLGSDSPIFAHGGTYAAGITFYVLITGTPEDGFTRTIWPPIENLSTTDLVSDLASVDGYVGLYSLSQFTFSATNLTTSATGNIVYSYFIVPAEVTVELSEHFGTTEIAILSVIPILMIVAIMLIAVRGLTRYD